MSRKGEALRWYPALANLKPMPETGQPEKKWTEAELDEFDQQARAQFEETLRLSQQLRQAWLPSQDEPKPGTPEAAAAIKDAIKQGQDEPAVYQRGEDSRK